MVMRTPKQARSEATLHRLLRAVEDVLHEKGWDAASVLEIAQRSDSSVGAFYTRFSGKQAVLRYLDARLTDKAVALWNAFFNRPRWTHASAAEIVREFVAAAARAHRANAHLLRTIHVQIAAHGDPELQEHARRLDAFVAQRLSDLLLAHREEIGHRHPETAIPFALTMIASTLRERILFEDLDLAPLKVSDRELIDELSRGIIGYLQIEE